MFGLSIQTSLISLCKYLLIIISSEPLKAAQCFNTAREGVSTESFLRDKLLQTEETDVRKLEVLYYLKVGNLYILRFPTEYLYM